MPSDILPIVKETSENLLILGKAGVGKSTLIKVVKRHLGKKCVILCPTGIAAQNVNGVTIHSFFNLPIVDAFSSKEINICVRNLKSSDKYHRLQEIKTIIIDEISMVNATEISELNWNLKQKTISDLASIGHTLIEWYPLKVKKVNGLPCIHVSYRRQLGTNQIVLVNYYIFQNNDRMHTLTLSYRVSETSIWKTDFDRILSSFRITNVK